MNNKLCKQTGKVKHKTKHTATKHMYSLVSTGQNINSLNAYKCASCNFWHVGHSRIKLGV